MAVHGTMVQSWQHWYKYHRWLVYSSTNTNIESREYLEVLLPSYSITQEKGKGAVATS
jgi:hypothetical protein